MHAAVYIYILPYLDSVPGVTVNIDQFSVQ